MPRILRLLTAAALVTLLCGASCQHKPDRPDPAIVTRPVPVMVERRVYVPVPPSLTRREPIAEGPIAMCFDVAAQRRAALERANAKLQQIEAIEGTEVTP